jgi:hypothetical protein
MSSAYFTRSSKPLPVCDCCKQSVDEVDDMHGHCPYCMEAECVQDYVASPCRLLKTPAPCCGFVLEKKDWGYLDGPRTADHCIHVDVMRYCDSCSERWYRASNEPDWDVDGCGKEDCPDCVEHFAKEKAAS